LNAHLKWHPQLGVGAVAPIVVFGVALCAIWANNFLLFHSAAEMFSVIVGVSSAIVAWYSRDWIGRNYLLLLGLSGLFVGVLDTVHALAYKGLSVFPDGGGNRAAQLWLSARALEAANFLVAVWAPQRRYRVGLVLALESVAVAGLLAVAFLGWWPDTYIEGVGVTPLKVTVELALAAAFTVVLLRLRRRAEDFDPTVYRLLVLCVATKVTTELALSWYVGLFGLINYLGHTLKIISAWLLMRAVVDTGLRRPQALIFGAMERERVLADAVADHARTLDAVLDAALDPVVMLDGNGCLRFASKAAERFFDRGAREIVGRTWREAGLPEGLLAQLEQIAQTVLREGVPRTAEITATCFGRRLCLEVQVSPVGGDGMVPDAVVVLMRDITARNEMEENLKASLEDNRVLVQEVHHRVKNNLQIVSSILQMQGWRMTDPALRLHFEEACGRILSLAKVHELLYNQKNMASLDFALYVRTLCSELFRLHHLREDRVILSVEAGTSLAVDKAEPLALVVHELVADAVKHAFSDGGGKLRVHLSCPAPDLGALVVADSGAKADRPMNFDDNSSTLGLRMVGALVRQLRGTIDVRRGNGLEVEVRFPLLDLPAAV
jgi:PAS domain S-box-containing protein